MHPAHQQPQPGHSTWCTLGDQFVIFNPGMRAASPQVWVSGSLLRSQDELVFAVCSKEPDVLLPTACSKGFLRPSPELDTSNLTSDL